VDETGFGLGSEGPDVANLQLKLNESLKPSPNLVTDGKYGNSTWAAVKRFQEANWLNENGEADLATQNCLFGCETYQPILHQVRFIRQPDERTCWAASTAMMTNSTVEDVIKKTPPGFLINRGLQNWSKSDGWHMRRMELFGDIHGLNPYPPMSWPPSALVTALQRGPLMIEMLRDSASYARGKGSEGHMIVVAGARGDGDPDGSGKGTTLRILDPSPPRIGSVVSVCAYWWLRRQPTRTYCVWQKK